MIIRMTESHKASVTTVTGKRLEHFSSMSVEFDSSEVASLHEEETLEESLKKLKARLLYHVYQTANKMVTNPSGIIEEYSTNNAKDIVGDLKVFE